MTKVLLLGATGYLGNNLANLLVRSGQHVVYGVARTPEKAQQLARQEIVPVLCPDPVNEPFPYLSVIRSAHIDIVVDVAGADSGSYNFLRDIKQIGAERLASYHETGTRGPKLGFIYCSGTWVHGSSHTNAVNDLDPVGPSPNAPTPPCKLTAWRVDLEKAVLNSADILDVMILRPALLYGRESTIWSPYLLPILDAVRNNDEKGEAKAQAHLKIPLDAESRPGLIHVDDAAKGFQNAIEKLPLIAGSGSAVYPVFDLVTTQERMADIFDAVAACWGFEGAVELSGSEGDLFAEAMSTSFRGSSTRAKQLLGWQPMRLDGFVRDMNLYAAAFAASQ